MNSFDSKSNSDSKKFSFDGKVLNSQLSALTTDCSSDSDSEDGKIGILRIKYKKTRFQIGLLKDNSEK